MRYVIFFFVMFLSFNSISQIVDIPDGNFKQLLIENGVDTNGDLEIQLSEAEAVESLLIDDSNISSIEGIKSFKNLVSLDIQKFSLNLSSVNLSDLIFLEEVKFNTSTSYEAVDMTGCTSLLEARFFEVETLNLTNCSSLELIDIHMFTEIELSGCENLSSFKLAVYDQLDFSTLGLITLDSLIIGGINSSDLNVVNLPDLKYLYASDPGSIFIRDCPKLEQIIVDNAMLNLDIADLPNLKNVNIGTILSEGNLNIQNCQSLEDVNISIADFANTVNINDCSDLMNFAFTQYADLELLIISNCSSIVDLNLTTATQPKSVDLTGLSSLKTLFLNAGPTKLILDGCYSLESYGYVFSFTEVLDFSDCVNLKEIDLHSSFYLKTLILQNGTPEIVALSDLEVLSHVCVDPEEFVEMTAYLSTFENLDVEVTTSCDFADGGEPFSVTGTSYLDVNNDSCKTSTQTLSFSKYVINDGIGEKYFYTNEEGNYQYKLIDGQYTFGPELLFGDYIFTSFPESQNATFPSEGSSVNQDFCFIASSEEVDVIEVHLIPLEPARPGFDSRYLITYTNTGNVTRGGDIKLTFQDEFMDYLMSEPMVDIQETGFLSWNFEDLIPYETRRIEFTMNLNSPMDTPPLNGEDILNFKAEVGPLGNQTLTVYWSNLNQDVVNSFDPNDKTCLNGNAFDQEFVGDYLKYMIRFENTGSAEAINIVVIDTLDNTKFDVRTLQVINASHEVVTEITENVIKFIFKDIYLPFEDETNDGYVTFKIKTLPSLVLGDDIQNKAEIFFDFNFPIVTNTTSTIISDFTSVDDLKQNTFDLEISPNPTSESILISSDAMMSRIELIDISGKLLESVSFVENKSQHIHSIQHLLSGVYFMKAYSKNGVSIKKIVIK